MKKSPLLSIVLLNGFLTAIYCCRQKNFLAQTVIDIWCYFVYFFWLSKNVILGLSNYKSVHKHERFRFLLYLTKFQITYLITHTFFRSFLSGFQLIIPTVIFCIASLDEGQWCWHSLYVFWKEGVAVHFDLTFSQISPGS